MVVAPSRGTSHEAGDSVRLGASLSKNSRANCFSPKNRLRFAALSAYVRTITSS
jgi:hypothetical protein